MTITSNWWSIPTLKHKICSYLSAYSLNSSHLFQYAKKEDFFPIFSVEWISARKKSMLIIDIIWAWETGLFFKYAKEKEIDLYIKFSISRTWTRRNIPVSGFARDWRSYTLSTARKMLFLSHFVEMRLL